MGKDVTAAFNTSSPSSRSKPEDFIALIIDHESEEEKAAGAVVDGGAAAESSTEGPSKKRKNIPSANHNGSSSNEASDGKSSPPAKRRTTHNWGPGRIWKVPAAIPSPRLQSPDAPPFSPLTPQIRLMPLGDSLSDFEPLELPLSAYYQERDFGKTWRIPAAIPSPRPQSPETPPSSPLTPPNILPMRGSAGEIEPLELPPSAYKQDE